MIVAEAVSKPASKTVTPVRRLLTLASIAAIFLVSTSAVPLRAQAPAAAPAQAAHSDLVGQWQGTLETPNKSLRTIVVVTKTDKGLAARFYSPDQGAQGFNAQSASLSGSAVKVDMSVIGGVYTGTLSADGNSIVGSWVQGPSPLPLTLVRATKETAWEIPAPPPPIKLMAADADPSFDVATIKPDNTGSTSLKQLTVNGRNFTVRGGSLADLIAFANNIQIKQIVNGPDWTTTDRFDISATMQPEGAPSPTQLRTMIQKLLADRFALKFHHDQRELSAYVMTVAKSGQKLTPTQLKGPLPGLGLRPSSNPLGITLNVRNGTVGDFTGFLQTIVLDRPVVDRTGLTDRFDFQVTYTPDESQFNGHPPKPPAAADGSALAEPAPDLFEALQQQVGLKLDAQKTQVDVLAIDHVDKPSAN